MCGASGAWIGREDCPKEFGRQRERRSGDAGSRQCSEDWLKGCWRVLGMESEWDEICKGLCCPDQSLLKFRHNLLHGVNL
jgi:hypothetical protein